MRLVVARLNHETNSFSPVATPLAAFEPAFDDAALAAAEGSATAMGAFLAFARARGARVEAPVFATANPSGPVEDEAFEVLAGRIVAAVGRARADAVLLDLHGAMVTASLADGEGELLARVRAATDAPVGLALDLHGNTTPAMIAGCDALAAFKTYPHVDMAATGAHVARLIGAVLDGAPRPRLARARPPVLAHTLRMDTRREGVMRDLIAAARAAEARGVLAASVFGGFPLSDVPEAGLSFVVAADSLARAQDEAGALAALAWERRAEFVYWEEPLADSVARARGLAAGRGEGPVLLLDHGDNCMSGATCDVMDLVAEARRQGLTGLLAGPIADPAAVAAMTAAGLGARVTLPVGNKVAMPLLGTGVAKPPVVLEGAVRALGDGEYTVTGPTYTGQRCRMGRAAVLDAGWATVLVTERPHEPWDLAVFTSLGLEPAAARFLALKSRMYARPVFEPLSRAVVECASLGVTSSDHALFRFERLKRPVFPLDDGARYP